MGKKGKNTVKNAQPKLDEDHAILDKAIEDAKIERSKMAQEDLKVQVESSALARPTRRSTWRRTSRPSYVTTSTPT